MKFSQVSIGQRFTYQGEAYSKSSPVLATNESSGEKKFFKRADLVELPEQATASEYVSSKPVELQFVQQAFDKFHQSVRDSLAENLDAEAYEKLDQQIADFAGEFTRSLEK